jgi:hypothetical protein
LAINFDDLYLGANVYFTSETSSYLGKVTDVRACEILKILWVANTDSDYHNKEYSYVKHGSDWLDFAYIITDKEFLAHLITMAK